MALRPASAPASLTERSPLLPEEEEPFPPPSASPPLPSALAPVPFPFPEPSQSDVKRTAPAAGTDAIMKNDERQEEQTDEEAALIASGSSIPFPRQPDPAKPFRAPEDETIRFRVTNFYQRNQGLMLIALAQVFYR